MVSINKTPDKPDDQKEAQCPKNNLKKLRLNIIGTVQMPLFRVISKTIADQLEIKGHAKLEKNGTLTIETIGSPKAIDAFIEELQKSPTPYSKVLRISITPDLSIPDYNDYSYE